MATPGRNACFINLHLGAPNNAFYALLRGEPDSSKRVEEDSDLRLSQSQALRAFVDRPDGLVLVAGGFNPPPDSLVYRASWSGMCNASSSAGWGFGYTYFHGKHSQVRIDHILGSPAWQCSRCWVGPDVVSMHRPLIADMEWVGPTGESRKEPTLFLFRKPPCERYAQPRGHFGDGQRLGFLMLALIAANRPARP